MKRFTNTLGILGFCVLATACGNIEQLNVANPSEELLELTETVSDDELNLRVMPVYRNSGAIVVESSIHVERADLAYATVIPQPPKAKCILHKGSLLTDLRESSASEIIGHVSYPKEVKISVTRSSCQQGQLIRVSAKSQFKGLALTKNREGVKFAQLENSKTNCTVYGFRGNIRIRPNAKAKHFTGVVVPAQGIQSMDFRLNECLSKTNIIVDSKALRHSLSASQTLPHPPTPCGKEKIIGDTDLTAPSLSLRCLPPPKPVSETMKSEASPEENG